MVELNREQKDILSQYKEDLKNNNFYNLFSDLCDKFSYGVKDSFNNLQSISSFLLSMFTYEEIMKDWPDIPANCFSSNSSRQHNILPKSCIVPNSVIMLRKSAFYRNEDLEEIHIPSSVYGISYQCFSDCSSLSTVVLDEGLKDIRSYAFQNCTALESIIIPTTVDRLDRGSFIGCTALKTIKLPEKFRDADIRSLNRAEIEYY